jgi:peptide/nickel transport system permease protein
MGTYTLRRLLQAILIVLIVSVLIFTIIRMMPGDPIGILVARTTNDDPVALEAHLRHEFGLDKPPVLQYLSWIGGLFKGDLGISIIYRYDIAETIASRLPVTLGMGLTAFVIGLIIGPLIGIICAIKRGTWIDNLLTVVANVGITAPQFWVGILLIYLFSVTLKWLPTFGHVPFFSNPVGWIQHSIMPIIALSLYPIASAARQTRSSVLEVLKEDYIRTAWSKGLAQKRIVVKHVLKNAMMPVVTLQGLNLRNIVGGSIVIETVFVIPGMGQLLVDAIASLDYTVVQGVVLVISIFVVMANLMVDLAYGWLDPRIQYE